MRKQFSLAYKNIRETLNLDKPTRDRFLLICTERTAAYSEMNAFAKALAPSIACKSGCSSCCHQNVDISASEACFIALYLATEAPKPPDLTKAAAIISQLTSEERWKRGIACPFLRNRICTIYQVRPQLCKTHLSLSRAACLSSWAQRKKPITVNIPFAAEPSLAGAQTRAGSDCALMNAGFQTLTGELTTMVERATQPGIVAGWLNREPVFPEDEAAGKYRATLTDIYQTAIKAGDVPA